MESPTYSSRPRPHHSTKFLLGLLLLSVCVGITSAEDYEPVCKIAGTHSCAVTDFHNMERVPEGFPAATVKCKRPSKPKPALSGGWNISPDYHYFFDVMVAKNVLKIIDRGESLVEFGAGMGCYRHFFETSGHMSAVYAYDGAANVAEITRYTVGHIDLGLKQNVEVADWVMSLEVGEHIPPEHEAAFLDNIVRHSTKGVIISWALPTSTGNGHVNTHTHEYIEDRMIELGYHLCQEEGALIRDSAILSWMRNNIMVFRKAGETCKSFF